MSWFDGFPGSLHRVGEIDLFVRTGGNADGPPVLLLHGYPQTNAMWRRVASKLAADFSSNTRNTASARWPPTWWR